MNALIFIEGRLVGEMQLGVVQIHGQLFPPEGRAYFCPDCGDIWARIVVQDRPSRAVTIPCRRHHKHPYWPGGSIWLSWERELMAALPPQVLAREAKRHAEIYDELGGVL